MKTTDFNEEIYNQYYDSVGNYHFTGTKTGKHIIKLENAVDPNEFILNGESERMRLIDADAEIAKIEDEIERYKEKIQQWNDNKADRNLYDVDLKLRELERNITDCRIEIKRIRQYETVKMEEQGKEIRDKAIEEFYEIIEEHMKIVGTTYLEDIKEIAKQMKEVGEC